MDTMRIQGDKPKWPYKEITTMSAHPNGQWAKRIRGRLLYFGPWSDARGARDRYLTHAADLHSGRQLAVAEKQAPMTMERLAEAYLHDAEHRRDTGAITDRAFRDYGHVAQIAVDVIGYDTRLDNLTPRHWSDIRRELAERFAAVTLRNRIVWIRQMLRWGAEMRYIKEPVYGRSFSPPSKLEIRRYKRTREHRDFGADQILALLQASRLPFTAMILLGINGGFGNADCADLNIEDLDHDRRRIDYYRVKTGIKRTIPLWPSTSEALRRVIGERTSGPVFLTQRRQRWDAAKNTSVAGEFAKLRVKVKLNPTVDEDGVTRYNGGFYGLRRTFARVGRATGDSDACSRIMGHDIAGGAIAAEYVVDVEPERLIRVVTHVERWLHSVG